MSILRWTLLVLPAAILMSQNSFAAEPRQLFDVAYSGALQFDAWLPGGAEPAPAVILVHGGAWVRGDRRTNVAPLFRPLSEAGFAWFSISYTLATNPIEIGTAGTDVEAAIRFIRTHAREYNIDPDRIALVGESAGAQLAAMAALAGSEQSAVKAVVAMYMPCDLPALAKSSTLIPESVRKQLRGTPWEWMILARLGQLSPIVSVRRDMPPFLLIHGDADSVVPLAQSQAMCERMKAVGASCEMLTVPGAGHGIRWWEGSAAKTDLYKREMVRWLRRQLGQPASSLTAATARSI